MLIRLFPNKNSVQRDNGGREVRLMEKKEGLISSAGEQPRVAWRLE